MLIDVMPSSVDKAGNMILNLTDSPLINIMLFLLIVLALVGMYKNITKKEAAPSTGGEGLLLKMDDLQRTLEKLLDRNERVSDKLIDKIDAIEKTIIEIKYKQHHED